MSDAEKITRQVARSRPELATLIIVVAMFLAAQIVLVTRGTDALEHNAAAMRELAVVIEALRR